MSLSQERALQGNLFFTKDGWIKTALELNWKRIFFICLGLGLFSIIYWCPPWPDAIDPMGEHFVLSKEAKGALALFALIWFW